jgi:3-oxoacyl-[acyl-carrier-protein] synthase II
MRVVISAAGVVSAHGAGLSALERALREGQSAVRKVTRFDTTGLCSDVAAEVPIDTRGDRCAALLDIAADEALPTKRKPARRAVLLATTKGSLEEVLAGRTDDPFADLCAKFARRCDANGPVRTLGAACASSSAAIGDAFDLLHADACDEVIVAGAEALHRFVYAGFHSLKALSPEPARPFDAQRKGLSMGEAAVVLVLEREDRARDVLAYVDGFGAATDAHDQTAPSPKGEGLHAACAAALRGAGLEAKSLGRYHAHGTATPHNDRMEAAACESLFGARGIPVTAAKGSVGHTLGAAGALDVLSCVLGLRARELWPVANLREIDPALTVDAVRERRAHSAPTAMVATAGFGGINTAVVVSR